MADLRAFVHDLGYLKKTGLASEVKQSCKCARSAPACDCADPVKRRARDPFSRDASRASKRLYWVSIQGGQILFC